MVNAHADLKKVASVAVIWWPYVSLNRQFLLFVLSAKTLIKGRVLHFFALK